MSHIHDALKKAQKERGARSPKPPGISPAGVHKPKFLSAKALWVPPVVLASVALVVYFWLSPGDRKPQAFHPSGAETRAGIEQPAVPQKTAVTKVAAKPDVQVQKAPPARFKVAPEAPKRFKAPSAPPTKRPSGAEMAAAIQKQPAPERTSIPQKTAVTKAAAKPDVQVQKAPPARFKAPSAPHPSGAETRAGIEQPVVPERASIPQKTAVTKVAAKPDVQVQKAPPTKSKAPSASPTTGGRQTVQNTRVTPGPMPGSGTQVASRPPTSARREPMAKPQEKHDLNRAPVVPPPPKAAQKPRAAAKAGILYDNARSFQKSGRLQEAKALYEKTLQEDPKHVDALNNMGVIYLHDRDYPAAREAFSDVIRLKPNYADGYYNLACAYAMEGRIPESLIHLKKAMSLNPSVGAWAKNDTDLANLRGVPDFEEIVTNR